jgi:UDP-2,3-diacylglucosamine hydrolase
VADAVAALPPAREWRVPDGWRAVDFVSDLHLKADLPRTAEAFVRYLEHTRADAVLILGDLFEFWPGDDAAQLPFERRCLDALGAAARRRTVAMMVGNRDFLIRPALLQAHGLQRLSDPTLLAGFGMRVLLTHGDALCLGDLAYQQFRRWARDPQTQAAFLARPLAERIALGAQVRHASEAGRSTTPPPGGWGDIDLDAARDGLRAIGAGHLVHGHTHRPADEVLAPGIERHVLADWDFDGAAARGGVLRLGAGGFERLDPAQA